MQDLPRPWIYIANMNVKFEELKQQHRKKVMGKKYNSPPIVNNVFRLLQPFCNPDKYNGKKYFVLSELGKYETHANSFIKHSIRVEIVTKMVKYGWLREIVLPKNARRNKCYEGEIQEILQDPTNEKKIYNMRGQKYYTITDKGKTVYKNIKEILDAMSY